MIHTRTNRGIAKVPNGYVVAEVEYGREHDTAPEKIIRRKLIEGPIKGTGAKRRAIKVAGTNRVVPV